MLIDYAELTAEEALIAETMESEGHTDAEIAHAFFEYAQGIDREFPQVRRALQVDEFSPTLTEFAQMSNAQRLRCHHAWAKRRLNMTSDFYSLQA